MILAEFIEPLSDYWEVLANLLGEVVQLLGVYLVGRGGWLGLQGIKGGFDFSEFLATLFG